MATVRRNRKSKDIIAGALAIAKQVRKFPDTRLWLDYDHEADVLYISFTRPQNATDTIEDDGILLRYRGKQLVGITVLNEI